MKHQVVPAFVLALSTMAAQAMSGVDDPPQGREPKPVSYRRCAVMCLFLAYLVAPAWADPPAENPADKAFMGAMRDMMAGMHSAMPTGNTDADFVHMMLPHHQAAVDMAKAEIEYGKDEGLKALAKDIVTAQEKEIALMKAWEDKQKASH